MIARQWLTRVAAIALTVVAWMVVSATIGPTSAAPEKAAVRVKWEYKVLVGTDEKEMNKLGDEGWEQLQVTGGESYISSTSAPIANIGTRNTIAYAPIRQYFRRPK